MGNNVSILGLAVDSPASHRINVLTNWTLDSGKIARINSVKDDLANNRVDIYFDIVDGTGQNLKILTQATIQNPYNSLDSNHRIYVHAEDNGTTLSDDMGSGNAHHN